MEDHETPTERMVFHWQLTVKMIPQKANPFLEYVERNNEISVRIFEVHVILIVDNQHCQEQSISKRKDT